MDSNKNHQWLVCNRTVRFGDTDAAGVMHFYQIFRWCHEAWEESLERYGVNPLDVFPSLNTLEGLSPNVLLPIIHSEADYRLPIKIGDCLAIHLAPKKLGEDGFSIEFTFQRGQNNVAFAVIRHLAINAQSRRRCCLPNEIRSWIDASIQP